MSQNSSPKSLVMTLSSPYQPEPPKSPAPKPNQENKGDYYNKSSIRASPNKPNKFPPKPQNFPNQPPFISPIYSQMPFSFISSNGFFNPNLMFPNGQMQNSLPLYMNNTGPNFKSNEMHGRYQPNGGPIMNMMPQMMIQNQFRPSYLKLFNMTNLFNHSVILFYFPMT